MNNSPIVEMREIAPLTAWGVRYKVEQMLHECSCRFARMTSSVNAIRKNILRRKNAGK